MIPKLDRNDGEMIIKLVLTGLRGGWDAAEAAFQRSRSTGSIWTSAREIEEFLEGAENAMRLEVHGSVDGVPPPPIVISKGPDATKALTDLVAATLLRAQTKKPQV